MVAAITLRGPGFNPFGRVWAAYERSLRRRPLLTQAVSSAVLWGLGDGMAQRIETGGRGGTDVRRVALTAAFGGAVIGPAGHCWYLLLEELVVRLGLAAGTQAMLFKVVLDNVVYSPAYVLAFFAYGCLAIDRLSLGALAERLRSQFLPTMLAEAAVWPPYMAAVFARVPLQHQLLAVNVATLFDVCFLSWVRCSSGAEEQVGQGQEGQLQLQLQAKKKSARNGQVHQRAKLQQRSTTAGKGGSRRQQQEKGGSAKALANSKGRKEDGSGGPGFRLQEWFTGALMHLSQRRRASQQQPQQPPPRTPGDARRQELSACLWDASPEPTLGRWALLAASATYSTAGGGVLRGAQQAAAAAAAKMTRK